MKERKEERWIVKRIKTESIPLKNKMISKMSNDWGEKKQIKPMDFNKTQTINNVVQISKHANTKTTHANKPTEQPQVPPLIQQCGKIDNNNKAENAIK